MDAKINYEKKIEEIKKYTKSCVSESRFSHSLRTAKMCEQICERYGINSQKGYLCGVAHDMCKKLDDSQLIQLAEQDGNPVSQIEKDKPSLLHGRAAAVKIQQEFGIDDPEIIQAIANHTFGGENLCSLAKALYAADKIEPGREHVTREYIDNLLKMPLDEMLYSVVSESVAYLTKKGKKINPITLKFLEELKRSF